MLLAGAVRATVELQVEPSREPHALALEAFPPEVTVDDGSYTWSAVVESTLPPVAIVVRYVRATHAQANLAKDRGHA